MKTIVQVWTQQCNNLKSDTHNNFFGFGDMLRGTIAMFQLSKKYNFHYRVDLHLHPISQFLKPSFVSDSIRHDNVPFVYPENIEKFIQNNTSLPLCHLFTNSFLIEPMTEECKSFMKNLLTPTDEFRNYIDSLNINKNTPPFYNIMHLRIGDSSLVRKESSNLSKYINILFRHTEENDIIMSDSTQFKEHLMVNNPNLFLFHIEIAHIGFIHHQNMLKDTLFEFFVMTQSRKIKTYTTYSHISGFVKMASLIYDIPLTIIQD
jgi:hypothetical protein